MKSRMVVVALALCALGGNEARAQILGGTGNGSLFNLSVTDRSGSITAGGTSQTLAALNLNRKVLLIQNPAAATAQGLGQVSVATISANGTGPYAPAQTISLAGGTFTTRGVLTISTTQVTAATVAAGGSGGVNGACTVTGTTGTGTKFQASGTIAGGILGGALTIAVNGSYTVNPTLLTAEPVTGCSLTGATLNINAGMTPSGVTVSTPGAYSVEPSSPVSQFASSGSGTGATWTILWAGSPESLYINDNGAAATLTNGNLAELVPGGSIVLDWNGHVDQTAITVNAATTGHFWNAKEMQ